MVGLPDCIRPFGFTPMNQFERFPIRFAAFMSKSKQVGGQTGNRSIDDPIAGSSLADVCSKAAYLAAND